MVKVYYCRVCKANVLEDAWDAKKQTCKTHARRSKYNAVKTEIDGILFDSQKEAHRYFALKTLLQAGKITDLQLQPSFPLVVNGQTVAHYIADFKYRATCTGHVVVEDVKSPATRTPTYRLKKKLVEALYAPLTITEV